MDWLQGMLFQSNNCLTILFLLVPLQVLIYNMESLFDFCAYFALAIFFLKFAKLLRFISSLLRRKQNLYEKYGSPKERSWAIITGATDGIGKGFALVLSDYGFNICLLSRTMSKLEKTSEEIKSRNPKIEVLSIQADFLSGNSAEFYDKIFEKIQKLDIAILVNNVGVRDRGPMEDTKLENVIDILTVNCYPQAMMTQRLFHKLSERTQRSAIINLSSFMSLRPFPWSALYSSTKAFNYFHSKSIAMELEKNVDVICLKPLYVSTNMTSGRQGSEVINIEQCAEGCLRHLGFETQTYGHWKHQIQGAILEKIVNSDLIYTPLWRIFGKKGMKEDIIRNEEFLNKRK